MLLGVDSSFFSPIVLSKTSCFPLFFRFAEKKASWKEWGGFNSNFLVAKHRPPNGPAPARGVTRSQVEEAEAWLRRAEEADLQPNEVSYTCVLAPVFQKTRYALDK